VTLDQLKQQRRWVLWRLEPGKGGKPTKVPYQSNGYKASLLNPKHLHTYAELEPHIVDFTGTGLVLGLVDGVFVAGIDIDACCDAVTGKFTPESRQVVIGLDSYAEYSPSGTGCHIWCIVDGLPALDCKNRSPVASKLRSRGKDTIRLSPADT
jgi:putative DNA primase/helicase